MAVPVVVKTLDDAFNGLMAYWQVRPNGGTRAELLAMAAAQGFAEPVLNQWLDVFIGGALALRIISTGTYAALAAERAAVTMDEAKVFARVVYDHLLDEGNALEPIRAANAAQILDATLAELDARLANIDQGIAFVLANTAPGAVRDDTLDATQKGRIFYQRVRDSRAAERDRLNAVAAG